MSILSYECIMSVDSLDALVQLYDQNEYRFPSEKDFLKFLKRDWREAIDEVVQRRKAENYEDNYNIEPLEVKVDDVQYKIYGIIHENGYAPKNYFDKIIKKLGEEVSEGGYLFFEQNLRKFLGLGDIDIEINDHFLRSSSTCIGDGFKTGFFKPLYPLLVGLGIFYMLWKEYVVKEKNDKITYETFYRPTEGSSSLPSYVKLEIKQRDRLSLNSDEKRSAYMTEFVRQYPKKGNRILIVGNGHAPEIKYFLTHGVKDTEICKKAEQNVELSCYAPSIYEHSLNLIRKKESYSKLLGVGMGISALGYGIWQLF